MSKYFIYQSTHLAVEELRKPRMGLRRHVHHPQEILTVTALFMNCTTS